MQGCRWCTEKLIDDNGLLSVNIPSNIAGGYYLVRPELLALHQADKNPPDPQFYIGCAQIFLQSLSNTLPTNTVSIPGYIHAGDPSTLFNIYEPKWPYPMPGPAVYPSSSLSHNPSEADVGPKTQTEGLAPLNCILNNANWCGIELDDYTTETGCWNVSPGILELKNKQNSCANSCAGEQSMLEPSNRLLQLCTSNRR